MDLGMVGLGRMGGNMAERLVRGGHRVVGYSRTAATVQRAAEKGVEGVDSLPALVQKLAPPRAVWLMVPAGGPVDQVLQALVPELASGDVVVEGGNSRYKDTMRRAADLKHHGLHLVDVGTSGGVWGLTEGYSMMVGGEEEPVERLRPILETLAPAPDRGWGHVGPSGAGHFVKMVHNGIEYGMMQAYAEGFAIMERKAELGLDLQQVAEIWRYGSVVRSWLLDLIARALADDSDLSDVAPHVADSGEGRWTAFEAIDLDVSAPVITLSLLQRLRSRDERSFADRLLAVLRHQFGGHAFKREGGDQ
ncbi:MAG: phosphogluconate dehydrogenase (NAD(+)-dependent, decarboxylating) [Armatimonadota bacterium]